MKNEVNRALVAKKEKLKIVDYGFTTDDRSTVRVYTAVCDRDGNAMRASGIIEAKRCPIGASEHSGKSHPTLYCTREGVFLSLSRFGLREVQQNESARYLAGGHRGGSRYPKLSAFGNKACHILMWETWKGARTPGMEIDHLNGDKMDCRLCNLEEVTPEENRKRAKLLRVLRSIGRDPRKMGREELLTIFRKYEFRNEIPD